jgi:hypothetical protein
MPSYPDAEPGFRLKITSLISSLTQKYNEFTEKMINKLM